MGEPPAAPPAVPAVPAPEPRPEPNRAARATLVALVVGLAACSALFRLVRPTPLGRSAVLFVGLPALLAIWVILAPPARSVTGMLFRAMTILLLLTAMFALEGTPCILMAAPLFYLLMLLIGLPIDLVRSRRRDAGPRAYGLVLLPFLLMSTEGALPATTFDRAGAAAVTRVVAGTPEQVEAALARTPVFDERLPWLLHSGRFPRPVRAAGAGLAVGDERVVTFTRGELALVVAERSAGRVVFRAVRDTTPIADWLGWREAVVTWRAAGPGRTEVRWELAYERRLDPVWYFGPLQSYAVRRTGGYLVATLATP